MEPPRHRARWRVLSLGVASLLFACGRAPVVDERPPGPAAPAPGTPPPPLPSASSVPPPGSASATASASASPPPARCAFGRGVSGKLGGATAFLRLTRTGDALAGRYFYDDVTDDLGLAGKVEGEATFVLEETHGGAVAATWRGTCAADGTLRGEWAAADGKARHAFTLTVPARVTVGTRRQRLKVRTTDTLRPDENPFCELDRRFPVVLGLATDAIEQEIERTLAASYPESIRDERTVRETRACKEDARTGTGRISSTTGSFHVDFLDAHVLAMTTYGSTYATLTAHPILNHGAGVLNLDLATGRLLRIQDAVVSVDRVLHYALTSCTNESGRSIEFNGPAFSFLADGIGIMGTAYAYVDARLMYQGPVISYAALLREGLLQPGFAQAALWAGTAPAPRGASPCLRVWQPE